jgi:S-adenosylmethionine:tRNA ribosyltransferase-isomerase
MGIKVETGGRVEGLILARDANDRWELLLKPSRRLRRGSIIQFGPLTAVLDTDPVDGRAWCRLDGVEQVEQAVERHGELPLPPYITASPDDPDRYQTMFADQVGSAAAPTAGLHFTPRVVIGLERRGVSLTSVDLEVGLATFRPIGTDTIEQHTMHSERCRVDSAAAAEIEACRERGGRVVAVGTTVVRTLESFAREDGTVSTGELDTNLYLMPGSRFRAVDLLVTNFHMPRSSLLVLLAGFMGTRWRNAYEMALQRDYRFLSFGDAMLCSRSSG